MLKESTGNVITCDSSIKGNLPRGKSNVNFLSRYTDGGEENQWKGAYIHRRAGKATGKYANSLNIQLDSEENITCVNWKEIVADWRENKSTDEDISEDVEVVFITNAIQLHNQKVIDARIAVLQKFKENNILKCKMRDKKP